MLLPPCYRLVRAGLLPALIAISTACQEAIGQQGEATPRSQGVAILELFTSQGCSSCPPADRLLAKIDEVAEQRGLPIYALSMHVDYWNRLGWTDPYSSKQFTTRQRDYAAATGSRSVYTPQMIVNGVTEFVGSDGKKAEQALSDALSRPAAAKIALTATGAPGGGVRVSYQVEGASPGSDVVVCLVADAKPNEVPRGENAGRRLSHHGVVRALSVAKLNRSGRGEVILPPPAKIDGLGVVAFVQQRQSRQVDGAAQVKIAPTVSASASGLPGRQPLP